MTTKIFLFPTKKIPTYLTAPVVKGDIQDIVLASGTLQALNQVNVGAQATGQLKSLKVALGDDVKKGQLVAEIDSMTQQNALRIKKAELERIRAELRSQRATLRLNQLKFARQQRILLNDAGSQEDYETADAALETTRADISGLVAQIAQAKIAVETAVVNLGYTKIIAPIDGKVVAIVTKEGQTLNALQSAPTILIVAQLDTITVKSQISEADVTRVAPGQNVHFTILGDPDHRYRATLRSIEPAPDSIIADINSNVGKTDATSKAVYYNGLFDIPNPGNKLRIGMTAQVSIVLQDAQNALIIPSVALGKKSENGSYAVRVVAHKNQLAVIRQVQIGINNNAHAQVLKGLQISQQVVVGEAHSGDADAHDQAGAAS
ncbi:efflux RND transporter periplasmic adaptor subunit [Glaciimonas immobilis]|uniref:Macrolide-specific efflux system membrane fusion protein n=1 Tax=Glaciimonas immobilis TaxID=728004 RepID=A0A840RTV9_9BURK|nr:efflux RND transporter periplasmic adaptor subunit [Glaciimonas immobilis]MBB5200478.1 macrolide-specific efflux system membrane fusion protein [Glaciimonas immobilis]